MHNQFTSDMLSRLDAARARARDVALGLGPDQLNWHPPQGGWSVGQCLEHLTIAAVLYHERLRSALPRARRQAGAGGVFRPSLVGRFFIGNAGPTGTRKVKAPSVFAPPERARADIVEEFERSHALMDALIRDADGLELSKVKVASPVSRWIRFTIGDAIMLTIAHAERHLDQAQRIRAHPSFPGLEKESLGS